MTFAGLSGDEMNDFIKTDMTTPQRKDFGKNTTQADKDNKVNCTNRSRKS